MVVCAIRFAPCPPVLFTTLPRSYGAELSPSRVTSKEEAAISGASYATPRLTPTKRGKKDERKAPARHPIRCKPALRAYPERSGLRLRLQTAGTRFRSRGPHLARRGHGRAGRPLRLLVVVCAYDLFAAHQRVDFLAADGLVFHQRLGDGLQLVAVVGQHIPGLALAFRDDAADFFVDQP